MNEFKKDVIKEQEKVFKEKEKVFKEKEKETNSQLKALQKQNLEQAKDVSYFSH